MVYMTDGKRPEWSSSGGNVSLLQTRGTMACLIISALCCWNSGCVGCAELPGPILALFQAKTIFSCSLSEEKTEWAWRSCGILSEPKQPPLAAFYPYRRSSRGGLSFGSTVEQNGEPSAFSCRHNIISQQSRAGEGEKDGTGDGDKPGV